MQVKHQAHETGGLLPVVLDVRPLELGEREFYELCRANGEVRLELGADGGLVIMPPTGSRTGWRNARVVSRLTAWAEREGNGLTFDSSTGFALPNGAKRSPDAAWVSRERWEALTGEEQEGFAPLCPDLVVELRSPGDDLPLLAGKMDEYMDNGARLGWLIDPLAGEVHVYRRDSPVERLHRPEAVAGDPVLAGFVLRTGDLFE